MVFCNPLHRIPHPDHVILFGVGLQPVLPPAPILGPYIERTSGNFHRLTDEGIHLRMPSGAGCIIRLARTHHHVTYFELCHGFGRVDDLCGKIVRADNPAMAVGSALVGMPRIFPASDLGPLVIRRNNEFPAIAVPAGPLHLCAGNDAKCLGLVYYALRYHVCVYWGCKGTNNLVPCQRVVENFLSSASFRSPSSSFIDRGDSRTSASSARTPSLPSA